jgi:hypothetical protein
VAARSLSARERTPLLAGVVGRFSRMASIVVAVLILSGIVRAVALVGSVAALFDTAYGPAAARRRRRGARPRRDRPAPSRGFRGGLPAHGVGVTSVLVATDPPAG